MNKRIEISQTTHEQLTELAFLHGRTLKSELAIAVNARWSLLEKSSTGTLPDRWDEDMDDDGVASNGNG